MVAYPGTSVSVLILPQLWSTDPRMDMYSMAKRKCRFKHEMPQSRVHLFGIYQQDNCKYECALNFVIPKFECIPWDIPYNFVMDKTRICNGPTSAKFKQSLENITMEDCPDCALPLCNEVSFTNKVFFARV